MSLYTTEIASSSLASDNPVHQRLYLPYVEALKYVKGDLLEVGCGEGRGVEVLGPVCNSYTAIDKNSPIIESLSKKYENVHFHKAFIPPMDFLADGKYDAIVSFQVIEHIKNDKFYLQEFYRVLKSGGKALITTPNRKMSLSRNPWHEREYLADELQKLSAGIFDKVTLKGLHGNEKVMKYYEENKASVNKITRFDILKLQYRLPAPLLRIPYDLLNRMNRNKLMKGDNSLVNDIKYTDYFISDDLTDCLDFFAVLEKK